MQAFVPADVLCLSTHLFLVYITWTEDSISFFVRPPHNALHLSQQNLLHEDENGRHFICKPNKEMVWIRLYIVRCYNLSGFLGTSYF